VTKTNSSRHWRGPTSIESGRASGAHTDTGPDEIGDGDSSDVDDTLLNVEEAAASLRVSPETVKYLRSQHRFAPAIRIGRRVMWLRSDVVAWRNQQRETA
jgi:predicted DNA-binding transcriptional regulator AlpA